MKKNIKTAAAILSLEILALALYFFFFNKAVIQKSFSVASFYLILVLFLFWIATLAKVWANHRPDLKSISRSYGAGIIFCLLACALVFISVKPGFRALADETNLLSVSRDMTFEHRVDNVTMGQWYYDNFQGLKQGIDKRPFLYPFLTHLLHTTTGFRPENAFVVNFILLAGLLMMVFIFARKVCGASWAYGAVILVLANPVVTQSATSGGFELCATFFTAASLVSLFYFLKTPNVLLFQLLWANLLMLANTRYESALFFMVLVPCLLLLRYVPWAYFGQAWIFPLTPLLMLPWLWQRMIFAAGANPYEAPAGVAPFSFDHLLNHHREFFKMMAQWDYVLPYAAPVFWLGLTGLVFLLIRAVRGYLKEYQRHFVLLSALPLWLTWGILTGYYFGTPLHALSSRLYVLFFVLLSLGALCLLRNILFARKRAAAVFLVPVFLFLLYHPNSVENRFGNTLLLPREYRTVLDFLEKQPGQNFLIIAARPGMYASRGYGAVDFQYSGRNADKLLSNLRRHLFRDIFVVQEILDETARPVEGASLDPRFKLSSVLELKNTETSFIRISRVGP